MNYLYLVGVGFVVSLGTIMVLGKKGNRYPGGSLAAGFLLSQQLGVNMFIGAICGVVGWLVLLAITLRLTKRAPDVGQAGQ